MTHQSREKSNKNEKEANDSKSKRQSISNEKNNIIQLTSEKEAKGRNANKGSDKNELMINTFNMDELRKQYLQAKKERSMMEKEVETIEHKLKILAFEEERAKKHIEREIKTREENLKTINEIAQQKDIILQAKMKDNEILKEKITKITQQKEKVRKVLRTVKTKVREEKKKEARDYIAEREFVERYKLNMVHENERSKKKKAAKIKQQKIRAKKKLNKLEQYKHNKIKSELEKELLEELNRKKSLMNKLQTFSTKETQMKAKLIETKILDLNSKSMIELGSYKPANK